jgi:hypothetical protein
MHTCHTYIHKYIYRRRSRSRGRSDVEREQCVCVRLIYIYIYMHTYMHTYIGGGAAGGGARAGSEMECMMQTMRRILIHEQHLERLEQMLPAIQSRIREPAIQSTLTRRRVTSRGGGCRTLIWMKTWAKLVSCAWMGEEMRSS